MALFFSDSVVHLLSIRLEGGDDVQLGEVLRAAGLDGASVDHDSGAVEASHGDETAGHVLVAARNGHQSIVPLDYA